MDTFRRRFNAQGVGLAAVDAGAAEGTLFIHLGYTVDNGNGAEGTDLLADTAADTEVVIEAR